MNDVIEIHEICEWDGGDRTVPTGIATTDKGLADILKGKHGTVKSHSFILVSSKEGVAEAYEDQKTMRALGKLSQVEKVLLGLPMETSKAMKIIRNHRSELAKKQQGK